MLYRLLNRINHPADLHRLSSEELVELAEEIRHLIISTVERTGGHLGANLGVVELTIALHSVLSSPRDRIIWDVGHQCYAHKILTGRFHQFATLRQWHGISGFPRPLRVNTTISAQGTAPQLFQPRRAWQSPGT